MSVSVGYIVGLGDRHIQNILIDEETAELVHIDLGKPTLSVMVIRNRNKQRVHFDPVFIFI